MPHPRRALAVAAPLVALLLTVSGCSAKPEPTPETTGSPLVAPGAGESSAARPTAAEPTAEQPTAGPTVLSLQSGDLAITATLSDSAAARSLVAQLPLTLDFADYGGQEKIATLPVPLDLDGAPDRAAAPAGTLGYYALDQGLVLYYDDVGAYPGIVPLGVLDDITALRESGDGAVEVRVQG